MKIYQYEKRGKSHVNLNIECQDYHKCIISEDNNTTITAVADGVGSCKFAKEGAQIAVNTAIEICRNHLPIEKNPEDFKAVIRMAMIVAEKEIIVSAKKKNESPIEFATTLMVVIGVDNAFYYGFCGDGGIIAYKNGSVEKITTPQKGEDGETVITLLSGSATMKFGSVENAASLLIATDGVYDKLCDNRLCFNKDSGLYNNLCYALMDVTDVEAPEKMYEAAFLGETGTLYNNLYCCIERNIGTNNLLFEQIKANGFFDKLINAIHDDITLVVISCNANTEQTSPDTYKEVDLNKFLIDLNKQLYPKIHSKSKKENFRADNSPTSNEDILRCSETVNNDKGFDSKKTFLNTKKSKKQNNKAKKRNLFILLLAFIFSKHRKRKKKNKGA